MAKYPLEWGWDPNTTDDSQTVDSSAATGRYPLEWGSHLDQPKDDTPQAPVFTPVMPTLLGGAPPDTFAIGGLPSVPRNVTPVSWPGGEVSTDTSTPTKAPQEDGAQLAQAGPPAQPPPLPAQGARGIAPLTEPQPGGLDYEAAMNSAVGKPVVLPNGAKVPDERSPTGYLMSPVPDLRHVAAAGRAAKGKISAFIGSPPGAMVPGSTDTFEPLFNELDGAIGHGGKFDYQRQVDSTRQSRFVQLPHFRDVSNFNAGLFMQQAGVSLTNTLRLAGLYAWKNSNNYNRNEEYGLDPWTRKYIEEGYKAGESGAFNRH